MDRLFLYLTDLSGGAAYFIIFGILIACGIGFPLPEDIPLIATGYLIWDDTITWLPAILVTMTGVLLGDTIIFTLGRKLGSRFLRQKGGKMFSEEKIHRTQAYFRKYGDKIVFFARFLVGVRSVAFFMAGTMDMKYRRYIFLDAMAALLSVPIWIGMGYALGHYFGEDINTYLKNLKHIKNIVTAVISTIVIIIVVRSFLKYQQAKKLNSNPKK